MVMWVKKIEWDDKSVGMGDFWITDGLYECMAFGYACYLNENEKVNQPLAAVFCEDILLSEIKEPYIKRMEEKDFYLHYCIGKIVDRSQCIVEIGGIILLVENNIPGDIKAGDYIEFLCGRIDI